MSAYNPSIRKDAKPGECEVDMYWSEGLAHGWTPCRRKVKGKLENGHNACGLHLGVEKRAKEREAAYQAKTNESDKMKGQADKVCEILAELGIEASVHFSAREFKYTGGITLDADNAIKLVEVLQK